MKLSVWAKNIRQTQIKNIEGFKIKSTKEDKEGIFGVIIRGEAIINVNIELYAGNKYKVSEHMKTVGH